MRLRTCLFSVVILTSVLGKRRRSTKPEPIAEVPLVREKRSLNLTDDEKKCMSKCSSCSPFISGQEETAMRAST